MRISQETQKMQRQKKLFFNKDVADSELVKSSLMMVGTTPVNLVSAYQPKILKIEYYGNAEFPPILWKTFNLVLPFYLSLPTIYFGNPIDPHNPHDIRFPKRSKPFLQLIGKLSWKCRFSPPILQETSMVYAKCGLNNCVFTI